MACPSSAGARRAARCGVFGRVPSATAAARADAAAAARPRSSRRRRPGRIPAFRPGSNPWLSGFRQGKRKPPGPVVPASRFMVTGMHPVGVRRSSPRVRGDSGAAGRGVQRVHPRAGGASGPHPRLSLFPRGLCTTSSWPGRIAASLVRMLSTTGRRSTMRFDGARMIRIRSPRPLGFCWCARPRSMLSSASKCFLALCSNAPFSVPAQPSAWTLLTSWPASSAARACGRFSSSRTRTANNVVARQTERGARLFLRH